MVAIDAIQDAEKIIRGVARQTPVLTNDVLNMLCGGRLYFKAEPLQLTGSFKIRGAYNRLARLNEEERRRGVVAFSSGNHAQGVAKAAQILDISAHIVMPKDAPELKARNTQSYGAKVVFYDRLTEDRERVARAIVGESGATLVPSYDDPYIIAGQGTVGLELAQFAKAQNLIFDDVIICLGGGGLSAGMSIALHDAMPNARIWGVEPEGYDDGARSLASGEIIELKAYPPTLCDALQTPKLGRLTFDILKDHLSGVDVVSEDEVRTAMRWAFQELKLVVEPGGAVALAAALSGRIDVKDRHVAIVLSGGNVDAARYAAIISKD